MPCKIYLRHDQSISQKASSQSDQVFVYAPSWVKEGIGILGEKLNGKEFTLLAKPSLKRGRNSEPAKEEVLDRFKITKDFDNWNLTLLQRIARNEARNTNGRVNMSFYQPDVKDPNLIYCLKNLARQTVIVGKDMTTFCGGYKNQRVKQKEPVYICDLAALQFQHPFNSGRLVLIQENDKFEGPLDNLIYEKVVGEKRKSFKEVAELVKLSNERYLKHDGFGKGSPCFMDTLAYKRFVKADVILSGLALSELADGNGDKLNLKFLKYGTGYFAGKFGPQLNSLILTGVVDGLEELFEKDVVRNVIKCVSFPFFDCDPGNKKRLEEIKRKYEIEYQFSREDALKQTMPGKGFVTATTNCADGNVACGNAMGFKSTDGAISENLESKGNIFCPNLNSQMKFKYVDI